MSKLMKRLKDLSVFYKKGDINALEKLTLQFLASAEENDLSYDEMLDLIIFNNLNNNSN